MKITIAVPCMDTLETEFVRRLTALEPVGDARLDFNSGSLVYNSREQLLVRALEADSDYILWLDSDMVFSPTLLKELLRDAEEGGLDFVSGLYFKRRPPYGACIFKTIRQGLPGESVAEDYDDYPRGELFEIDACGFGAVLMSAKLAADVLRNYRTGFIPLYGYGEDISFCIRAKKLGYRLWCDSRIQAGHITRTVIDETTSNIFHGRDTIGQCDHPDEDQGGSADQPHSA